MDIGNQIGKIRVLRGVFKAYTLSTRIRNIEPNNQIKSIILEKMLCFFIIININIYVIII